jgi:hypothetical protein
MKDVDVKILENKIETFVESFYDFGVELDSLPRIKTFFNECIDGLEDEIKDGMASSNLITKDWDIRG